MKKNYKEEQFFSIFHRYSINIDCFTNPSKEDQFTMERNTIHDDAYVKYEVDFHFLMKF